MTGGELIAARQAHEGHRVARRGALIEHATPLCQAHELFGDDHPLVEPIRAPQRHQVCAKSLSEHPRVVGTARQRHRLGRERLSSLHVVDVGR